MSWIHLTAHELNEALKKKSVSAKELVNAFFARIDSVEKEVHAYNTLLQKEALAQADRIDQAIARGEAVGPLAGVPIALKDNLCADGIRTTCSSKMLQNYTATYDATVVGRLRRAGAIFLGKTNMDEFAMGSSTENSAFEKTRNPWDLSRIPGGSSGGSAAAVAASEAVAALGSDTGGSIRQPAACCGVVGLKPTYGRVSRYGLVAFASSLDQIGPLTRDVTDAALLMNAIGGHDPSDSTSADLPMPDLTGALTGEIRGMRLGVPKEYFIEGMDPAVASTIAQAIETLKQLGAEIKEISLPHTEYAVATYYILATAEASSNLARFDGVRYGYRTPQAHDLLEMYMKSRQEGFGPEVKRRIMLGTYALSSGYYDAYYKKAQQVRTLIKRDFDNAFESVDAIVTPTAPTPAFRIGEKTADPLQMYLSDIFTISVNLAGIPAISIPCGFSQEGLPIGLQILGRAFDEAGVLRIADAYERTTDFHTRRPTL
ncbi:MAG: Asp-tRNA(Asn)/Glu-tRNA(Gln) amidotransferase subunit GatA [Nitrospirae bacterium]|nr:Asp-tRNA(Asn)/Glu-tRNA(Gln) amidotransferase subunit GatA [Candidatus Manganitrophaceae bacterium]